MKSWQGSQNGPVHFGMSPRSSWTSCISPWSSPKNKQKKSFSSRLCPEGVFQRLGVQGQSPGIKELPIPFGMGSSAWRKSLFAKLLQVFLNLKSSEKLMIKNERHPSWVSFVTIFLPVALDFRVYRQSEVRGNRGCLSLFQNAGMGGSAFGQGGKCSAG